MKIKGVSYYFLLTNLFAFLGNSAQAQPTSHETIAHQDQTSLEQTKKRRYPTLEEALQKCTLDAATHQLFIAAKTGDLATITNAIQAGMPIDTRLPEEAVTWCGATPLVIASLYGQNDIVKSLLAVGANVNNRLGNDHQKGDKNFPQWGGTPLIGAIRKKNLETVQILLEAGADITETMGFEGASALHLAVIVGASPELIHTLVKYGGQINNTLTDLECRLTNVPCKGSSPLLVAIANSDTKLAQTLIELGADIEAECPSFFGQDAPEATPLFLAIYRGNTDIIQSLIKAGVNLSRRIKQGDLAGGNALHLATELDQQEIVDLLIKSGITLKKRTTKHRKTALELAIYYNNASIASLINQARFAGML